MMSALSDLQNDINLILKDYCAKVEQQLLPCICFGTMELMRYYGKHSGKFNWCADYRHSQFSWMAVNQLYTEIITDYTDIRMTFVTQYSMLRNNLEWSESIARVAANNSMDAYISYVDTYYPFLAESHVEYVGDAVRRILHNESISGFAKFLFVTACNEFMSNWYIMDTQYLPCGLLDMRPLEIYNWVQSELQFGSPVANFANAVCSGCFDLNDVNDVYISLESELRVIASDNTDISVDDMVSILEKVIRGELEKHSILPEYYGHILSETVAKMLNL